MIRILTPIALLICCSPAMAQNGLSFDGQDDHGFAAVGGPVGNAPRTIEMWVKLAGLTTTQQVMLSMGEMPIGARFTLNVINGIPRIEVGGSGISGPSSIGAGTWHHLASTYDPAATPNVKLYVDGGVVASGDFTVPVNTSMDGGISIGRRQDSINYFNGLMDEIRVWDYARSATEIANNRTTEFCVIPDGLITYFKLNQGLAGGGNASVTVANNEVDPTNNADLSGFALSGSGSNWVNGAALSSNNFVTETVGTCGPYSSPSGNLYTTNGTYVDTVVSPTGCTALITTILTITPLDTNVTMSSSTLTAQATGLTYQWINCDEDSSLVSGATQRNFTPTISGTYAVQLSGDGCTATSNCHTITVVGIAEELAAAGLTVFPNPTTGPVNITTTAFWNNAPYRVMDLTGRTVQRGSLVGNGCTAMDLQHLKSALYILEVGGDMNSIRVAVFKD